MNIRSRVDIERDSKINNLEQSLLGQLSNIISSHEPRENKQITNQVQTISVEDALKELLQLTKP